MIHFVCVQHGEEFPGDNVQDSVVRGAVGSVVTLCHQRHRLGSGHQADSQRGEWCTGNRSNLVSVPFAHAHHTHYVLYEFQLEGMILFLFLLVWSMRAARQRVILIAVRKLYMPVCCDRS